MRHSFFVLNHLLIPFLLLSSSLLAIDFNEDPDLHLSDDQPLFISLGSNCVPALALRGTGLRRAAFPFDWLIIGDNHSLIRILNEDFLFFLDENVYQYGNSTGVSNQYYRLWFTHDFDLNPFISEKGREQWAEFKTKYSRRINRFQKLRNYSGRVFFVKNFWTEAYQGENGEFNNNTLQAQELKNALENYFPFLNFTLIIVSYLDLNIPLMQEIEGVVEFRIERSHEAFGSMANGLLTSDQ